MKTTLSVLLLFLAEIALAVTPTTTEIKKVLQYYNTGASEGPVLMDLNLCLKVDQRKASSTRYECIKKAPGQVKLGTPLTAWTSWFVPKKGEYADIMIQFVHEGLVRTTRDVKLAGGLKMRAFRSQVLNKPGAWEVRILRGKKAIASGKITVK